MPVQKDGTIFNLPILTGDYLKQMRRQWHYVQFMIIDEISMIPYEMICMIDSKLKQLKHSSDFFGGLNILLFGDLMQLPPVGGHAVFQQPGHMQPSTHLWRLFSLYEPTQKMEQHGDMTFIKLLNDLRVGKVNKDQVQILLATSTTTIPGILHLEKPFGFIQQFSK